MKYDRVGNFLLLLTISLIGLFFLMLGMAFGGADLRHLTRPAAAQGLFEGDTVVVGKFVHESGGDPNDGVCGFDYAVKTPSGRTIGIAPNSENRPFLPSLVAYPFQHRVTGLKTGCIPEVIWLGSWQECSDCREGRIYLPTSIMTAP